MKWIKKVATTPLNTIAQVIDSLSGSSATNAPSINAVNAAINNLLTTINGKQDTITGSASSITSNSLTANRAVICNGSKKIAVSNTTSTELGYVHGVRSAIQDQIDAKTGKIQTLDKTAEVTAANAGDVYSQTFTFTSSDGYKDADNSKIYSVESLTNSIRIISTTEATTQTGKRTYYVLYTGTSNGASGVIAMHLLMVKDINALS